MDGRKTILRGSRLCFLLLLLLTGLPAVSSAGLYYGFEGITNNNSADVLTGETQLTVEVSDHGSGQVLFTFRNSGLETSSITDVYFDDGTLLGIASVFNGPGVQYTQYVPGPKKDGGNLVCPPDLPGGNELSVPFVVTPGLSADSDSPAQPNGVNPGEGLGILFNLQAGKDFESVIAALDDGLANPGIVGSLRIGIHVQGFEGGGSESFINGEEVPVPGAVLLGLLGLSAAGLTLRRFA